MSRPSPSPSSSGVAGPSGSVSSLSLSAAEVAHEDEHSDHDDDEHEQTQTNTQTATGTGTTGTNAPVTSRKPRPSVNINSHIHANAFQSKLSFWRSGAAAAAAATKATGTGSGTSSLPSSASASGSLNRQQSVQSHAQTPTHTQSHATPTNTHTHAASPEPPSDTNTEEKEKEPGTHKRRYSAPHQEITDLLQFWKSQEKKKASDRAREQAINDTPRERPRVQLAAAVAMAREAERKAQLAAQELAEAKQRVARSQTAHVTIQPGRAIPTSMQAKERERLFQEHQAKLQKEAEEKQKAERDAKIKQEAEKQLFPHKKALEIIPNIQTVQQDSARKKQEEEEKRKREEAEREAKEAKDKIEAEKRAEQKRIAQAQAQAQAEAEAQRQKEQAQAEAEAAAKKQQEEAAKKAQEDAAKAKAEAQAAAERQAQEAAAAAVAATTAVTSTIASTPADEEIIPPTPLLTRLVTDFAQPQAQAQAQPSETSTSASASTSTSSSTSTSTSSVPSTVPVRGPVASRGSVASRPSTTPLVVSENDTSMLSNGPASRSTSVVSDGYDTDSSSDVEARLRTALTSAASTTASSGLSSGSTDFSTTNNSASILGTLRLHSIVERSNSISSQGSQSSISHASFPSAPHTLTPEEIEEIVQKEQRDAEQRQNVLVEVYKSEESYVNNLELLVAEFIHPLKSAQSNIEITQQQVSLMFSNVELLANFHRVFLADLTKSASVADVILKYADFLKMYTQYLNSYSTSLHTIDACRKNAKFVQFLAEKRKKCGLDLMSYLIMPVQRIPRYELLLRELIKYTPANHADLPRLHEAFSKIQNIASHVNEEKRQVENMSKLLEIQNSISGDFGTLLQPHRRLIREGQLMKLSQGILSKLHLRRVYLFSDILLWITTTSKFRGHMELEGAHISEFQEAGKKRFGFKIVTAKKSKEHIFICNSLEESKVWMDDILEARRVLEEAAEKARRRRQDIRKIKQATLKKTLKGGSQMHNMIQASLSSLDLHAGVDESASAAAISPSSRASAAVAVATAAGTGDATTFNFGIGAGTTGAAAGTMSPRAALMRENRTRDLSTVADKPGSNGSPRFVASPSLSSASSPTTSISSSSSVSVSSPTTTTTTTTGSGSYPLSPRSAGMFGHSSLQRDASGAVRTPATMNASEAAAVAAQLRAQQLAAAQALEEAGTPIVETIEDLLIDDDDSRLPGRSVSL